MSTKLCTDPYAILPISIHECIGQSLNTINAYYNVVLDDTCLQAEEAQALTSDLISLSADIYVLSADIKSFPQAFVAFSPKLSTVANTNKIFSSYNVKEVQVRGAGLYDIIFTTNLPSANFGSIATCSQVYNNTSNIRAHTSTNNNTVSSAQVRLVDNGTLTITNRPDVVAVAIFV